MLIVTCDGSLVGAASICACAISLPQNEMMYNFFFQKRKIFSYF